MVSWGVFAKIKQGLKKGGFKHKESVKGGYQLPDGSWNYYKRNSNRQALPPIEVLISNQRSQRK